MTASMSMFEQAMGAEFATLDAAVQRFHRLAGHHTLQGWVETTAPRSWMARLLAISLGSPLRNSEGPIRFELQAAPDQETWSRFFPTQGMRSTMHLCDGDIVECLGAARVTFHLSVAEKRLVMGLKRLHFLGIRCPAWLAPRLLAEECGAGDRLQFQIRATVPFVGVVASYRGYLEMPQEPKK